MNGSETQGRIERTRFRRLIGAVAVLAAAAVGTAVLASAAAPITADDLWWHLGLGEAFSAQGPWLSGDPLLFRAHSAPDPAAWLSDVLFFQIAQSLGLAGLRGLHVLLVAAMLLVVWRTARLSGASRQQSHLALLVFMTAGAYRLAQLRPHLFTILLGLILIALLLRANSRAGPWAIAALVGIWSNLHGGFVLGLVLIAACTGVGVLGRVLAPPQEMEDANRRLQQLAKTLALSTIASLANPIGYHAWLRLLPADSQRAGVSAITDDWGWFPLLHQASVTSPPTPATWLTLAVIASVSAASVWAARERIAALLTHEPARIAVAATGLGFALLGNRFSWLAFAPLLLVYALQGTRRPIPYCTVALALAFFVQGPWLITKSAIPNDVRGVLHDTYPAKYYSHAIWFLRDSQIEGRMYNDYFLGGWAGWWLAPQIETLVNGSLNTSEKILQNVLGAGQGRVPTARLMRLLDETEIDIFLGTGLPIERSSARDRPYTTALLSGHPDWILVFRNIDSAVYLRRKASNNINLDRIAAYYTSAAVPFDKEIGFRADAAIREQPRWAIQHGLLPKNRQQLNRMIAGKDAGASVRASERMATYAALAGLCGDVVARDCARLEAAPRASLARRRLLWCSFEPGIQIPCSLPVPEEGDALSERLGNVRKVRADTSRLGAAMLRRGEGAILMEAIRKPEMRERTPRARRPASGPPVRSQPDLAPAP